MEFECPICEGLVEAPEELAGGTLECPHCGGEIIAPEAEFEEHAPEEGAAVAHGPTSPEEFRIRMEARQSRDKIKTGLVFAGILLAIVVVGLVVVPPSTWVSMAEEATDKKARQEVYEARGLAPIGYYWAKELPGMTAGGKWPPPAGTAWLVIDLHASPRYFLPNDDDYGRIKEEAESKKARDPTWDVPSRERCRFFDAKKFLLVSEGAPAVTGTQVNLNYGTYKGFFESFQFVVPTGQEKDPDSMELDDSMTLSVAFAVEPRSVDLKKLWIQLGQQKGIEVPEKNLKAVTKS